MTNFVALKSGNLVLSSAADVEFLAEGIVMRYSVLLEPINAT